MYEVKIDIILKKTVLDPQGKTVQAALHSLGFPEVSEVRVGKFCDLKVAVPTRKEAEAKVHAMCDKLLVNAVIEEYSFTIEEI